MQLTRRDRGMTFVQRTATTADCCVVPGYVTIDTLPDEVLLGIFDFCMRAYKADLNRLRWVRLLHVCRRWRSIVLSAPVRLDLQTLYQCRRPTREILDILPALPIVIWMSHLHHEMEENAITALGHKNRVSGVWVRGDSNSALERIAEAMKHPFPILTRLAIESTDQTAMVLPDSLLGGCGARLRSLRLHNVTFSALPKLLLSTTGLVELGFSHLTHSRWISPEEMVDCLSSLTVLEQFRLEFKSYGRPDRTNRRPHSACTVLPTLTTLWFRGMTEYFDRLFSAVNAPSLNRVEIKFIDPPTFDSNFMRVTSLIGLTETFEMPDQAHMLIAHDLVDVIVSPRKGAKGDKMLQLSMTWKFSAWYLTRVCYPYSSPEFAIESSRQRIRARTMDRGRTHWLDLLHFFPATENLYLFERVASCIAFALQELAPEGVTEVLPALKNLFIDGLRSSGPIEEAIGEFVAARQLSGHPVAVQRWGRGRG